MCMSTRLLQIKSVKHLHFRMMELTESLCRICNCNWRNETKLWSTPKSMPNHWKEIMGHSRSHVQFNPTRAVSVSIVHHIEFLAVYAKIDQALVIDENFNPAVAWELTILGTLMLPYSILTSNGLLFLLGTAVLSSMLLFVPHPIGFHLN